VLDLDTELDLIVVPDHEQESIFGRAPFDERVFETDLARTSKLALIVAPFTGYSYRA
jgi:hypothetical protein